MVTSRFANHFQRPTISRAREFDQFLSQLQIKHFKTALSQAQSNAAVERFNRVLKEGVREAPAENRPLDKAIRSMLEKFLSKVHSMTGKTHAERTFGRRMIMTLDLIRVYPSQRHLSRHFDEHRRDSSISITNSEQSQLHQRL